MKRIKINDFLRIVNPEYSFLKLTPNKSIRNNNTHKIAKSIASLHKSIRENISAEESKLIRKFGREFMIGTKFTYNTPVKVAYLVYLEKKKAEFYFIVPHRYLSVIREKMTESWHGVTVSEAESFPYFNRDATKLQLVYAKEDALSLEADRRDNELLTSTLNVIDVLDEADRIGIFYNFVPVSQFSWRSTYRNTLTKVKRRMPVDRNKFGVNYVVMSVVSGLASVVNDLGEVLGGKRKKRNGQADMFEHILEQASGRRSISDSTTRKGNDVVLDTQILVISESADKIRQRNNAKSLAQSFGTISGDNTLIAKSFNGAFTPVKLRLNGVEVNRMSADECSNFIALPGRDILENYGFISKVDTQETQVPDDLRKGVMRIGTNMYRGNSQDAFLSNDKEYRFLTTVIIGPTRAGKTTLIGNLARDALNNGECTVLFDYIGNCELSDEVAVLFGKDRVLNIECDDFNTMQGLGYNEIRGSTDTFEQYRNAKMQTTQLTALVNSINSDDVRLSAKMERYLQAAANIVFISNGSIRDVFNVLQDEDERGDFVSRVPANQAENLAEYIGALAELDDYKEVKTKENGVTRTEHELDGTKTYLISGIIDRLNRLKANPYMELMLKKDTANNIDLVAELQKNQLICIRMPETMFSTDNERDAYTTYWITKLWLALQMRKAKFKDDRGKLTKVNLVIDELYQVANTERFITDIISRLAKFALKPIISCHYLNQIKYVREELRSANASYMLISGCDKANYAELKDELYPFELEDLLRLPRHHSLNLLKNKDGYARFITHLPPPVSADKTERTDRI